MSSDGSLFNITAAQSGGYGSEFDSDAEFSRRSKRNYEDQGLVCKKQKTCGVPHKNLVPSEYSKEEGRTRRFHILSLDAYARHKQFINNYLLYYRGNKDALKRDSSRDRRDIDVIRENHRFIWEDSDLSNDSWKKRLAKKYYDKLFREYCIVDLSRYKLNKFGMRWRTEAEVQSGKGQFSCGNKTCQDGDGLRSWEVNFGYTEQGEKRNALVKLRLCPDCSYKLNYKQKRKDVTRKSKKEKDIEPKSRTNTTDTTDQTQPSCEAGQESNDSSANGKSAAPDETGSNIWEGPAKVTEEKTLEDEFDEYFEDMFL